MFCWRAGSSRRLRSDSGTTVCHRVCSPAYTPRRRRSKRAAVRPAATKNTPAGRLTGNFIRDPSFTQPGREGPHAYNLYSSRSVGLDGLRIALWWHCGGFGDNSVAVVQRRHAADEAFCQAVSDRGYVHHSPVARQSSMSWLVRRVYSRISSMRPRPRATGPRSRYRVARKITDAVARPILASFVHVPVSFSMTFQETRCWE
jgi:hypothetical protein